MEIDLSGRTALVTGSSRNIGQEIAIMLAKAGADVGITAKSNESGCNETANKVEAYGREASVSFGDLGDLDDVEHVVDSTRDELGNIDILINNASIRPNSPFLDVTPEEWDQVHNVDLKSYYFLAQNIIPDMLEVGFGTIVNIVGMSVYLGSDHRSHVISNKAGINGLTRALAKEFGKDGIRANSLCIGSISTNSSHSNKPENWEKIRDDYINATALKRKGQPREIAECCTYLISDRASYITGQVIHVNGGIYPTANLTY